MSTEEKKEFLVKETVARTYEIYVMAQDEDEAIEVAQAKDKSQWNETTMERVPDDIEAEEQ